MPVDQNPPPRFGCTHRFGSGSRLVTARIPWLWDVMTDVHYQLTIDNTIAEKILRYDRTILELSFLGTHTSVWNVFYPVASHAYFVTFYFRFTFFFLSDHPWVLWGEGTGYSTPIFFKGYPDIHASATKCKIRHKTRHNMYGWKILTYATMPHITEKRKSLGKRNTDVTILLHQCR